MKLRRFLFGLLLSGAIGLLAMHGARLRALVERLGLRRALAELARCTHPTEKQRAA